MTALSCNLPKAECGDFNVGIVVGVNCTAVTITNNALEFTQALPRVTVRQSALVTHGLKSCDLAARLQSIHGANPG